MFIPMDLGIPLNDRLYYPLYAKCVELGVPVSLQVGHSAERMPSEFGRSIFIDTIALDFPRRWCNCHPQVFEVAVAAYQDKVLGERACAFVVLRAGAQMTLDAFLHLLRAQQMPTWQMPKRIELMQELPKSAGGKVMNNKLREYDAAKVKAEEAMQSQAA